MNQQRLFARAYVLRTIGELDDTTSQQLLAKLPAGMYGSADEALDDFESAESITIDLYEWIRDSWVEASGSTQPADFADAIVDDVLASIE